MAYSNRPANAEFLSSLDLVNARDIQKELFNTTSEMQDFDWFSEMNGRMVGTSSEKVEHYEEGSIFKAFTIASAVAGTGADAGKIVLTLNAASHTADGKHSYPRLEDTVVITSNSTQWTVHKKDTSVNNAHKLTVAPISDTDTIADLTALASVKAYIPTNSFAEGSDSPTGRTGDSVRYEYQTQIFKEAYEVTGSADTTESYIWVPGKDGVKRPFYTIRGEAATADRFRAEIAMGLLIGKKSKSGLVDASGNSKRTAEGLIPIVERSGVEQLFATTPTLDDLEALIKKLNVKRACDEYMFRPDHDLNVKLDRLISSEMQENAIRYEMIGGKEKARLAGFNTFAIGSYTFHKQEMKVFNHSELLGNDPKYTMFSLLIPLGFKKDPKNKKDQAQLQVRFKEGNGINRAYDVWEFGGQAKNRSNGQDKRTVTYLSEQTLQVMGAGDFGIFKKQ
jgi:hypothetical protein